MGRYVSPKYSFNIPDLQEPADVPADLRNVVDRLEVVLPMVDAGRDFYSGVGPPPAGLGVVGDVYYELPANG